MNLCNLLAINIASSANKNSTFKNIMPPGTPSVFTGLKTLRQSYTKFIRRATKYMPPKIVKPRASFGWAGQSFKWAAPRKKNFFYCNWNSSHFYYSGDFKLCSVTFR